MVSHYSRKNNNKKQFLKEGMNVHRMYDMYLEKYEPLVKEHERENFRARQEGRPSLPPLRRKVTYRRYLEVFNGEFNLVFGRPRIDTCAQCEKFNLILSNSVNPDEKQKTQDELRAHQIKADNGYKSKSNDRARAKQSWQGKRRLVYQMKFSLILKMQLI